MIALGTHLALVARALDEARWYGAILSARVELAVWHLRRGR